jgi:hypothetical protein
MLFLIFYITNKGKKLTPESMKFTSQLYQNIALISTKSNNFPEFISPSAHDLYVARYINFQLNAQTFCVIFFTCKSFPQLKR